MSVIFLREPDLYFNSVKNIIGNSKQVMVYGWNDCFGDKIMDGLADKRQSWVKKVFSYTLGDSDETHTTIEGKNIEKIFIDTGCDIRKTCKNALTNLLLENCKRTHEGKEIIPVIFCIQSYQSKFQCTIETMSSKDPKLNTLITNSELRRCYKLCCQLEESPHEEHQKIAQIAKQMFKFVYVGIKSKTTIFSQLPNCLFQLTHKALTVLKYEKYILKQIPSPWGPPNSLLLMKQRLELSAELRKREGCSSSQWRDQLISAAKKYKSEINQEEIINN